MTLYSTPDFWLGMLLLSLFGVTLGWFPIGGLQDPSSDATGVALLAEQAWHMVLPALTLTLAYLGEYALVMRSVAARHDARGLPGARTREGPAGRGGAQPPRGARTRCCRWSRSPRSTSASCSSGAIAVEAIFSWPGLGFATYEAIHGPDLPMLQGLFLVFSAAVILFNLIADLLYAALDPRVRDA